MIPRPAKSIFVAASVRASPGSMYWTRAKCIVVATNSSATPSIINPFGRPSALYSVNAAAGPTASGAA